MGTISLLEIDHAIFKFLNDLAGYSGFTDGVFVFFAEGIVYLMGAGLIFFVLQNKKNEAGYLSIFQSIISAFVSRLIIASIVREFYFRNRPFVSGIVNQLAYHNPLENSFPSGHASVMFAMAFSLLLTDFKLGVVYFILALISGTSRVIIGVHYPFDIIAGIFVAVISVIGTKFVFDFWMKERLRKALRRLLKT